MTLQLAGGKKYTFDPAIFIEEDQDFIQSWRFLSRGLLPPDELDERIKPGATFRVEMPELANTYSEQPAGFTISIPQSFNYPDPAPLLVFLNGGSGNESLKSAKSSSDPEKYIIVSFPYTSEINKDGPLGQSKSNMRLIESYHEKMLERLKELVPNISESQRIIAGSSNGAHILGSAIAMDWDCYLNYFRGFILWEGGGIISNDFKAVKGSKYVVWVGWGEKSEARDFVINIANSMEESRVEVTKEEVKGAGHGMHKNTHEAIKNWISNVAEPAFKNN